MPSKRTLLTVATCLATLNLYLPHVFAQQQTARVPMVVPDQVPSAVALDTHERGGDHREQALKWKSQLGSSYYFGQGEKLEANVIAVSGGGVEVLVGPEDRIQIGQRMEVFRDGIHRGAVEIADIQTRRSTAVLDLSASSLGMGHSETIKVGDLLIAGIPSVLKKTSGLSATGVTEVSENSGTAKPPVRSTNGRDAATEPAAGHYTGACQVMRIGPNGDVSYDDTPLSISHLEITAGGKLKAMFPDRTLGRGKWHTLTLTKVSTTPRAVWSAVMDETTFKATAIPFSPNAYVFRLEVTERGRLISGAQQFYAVDLKGK